MAAEDAHILEGNDNQTNVAQDPNTSNPLQPNAVVLEVSEDYLSNPDMPPLSKTYVARRSRRLKQHTHSQVDAKENEAGTRADIKASCDNKDESQSEEGNEDAEDQGNKDAEEQGDDANVDDGEAELQNSENISPIDNCVRAYKIISLCKDYILKNPRISISDLQAYMLKEHKIKLCPLASRNAILKVQRGSKGKAKPDTNAQQPPAQKTTRFKTMARKKVNPPTTPHNTKATSAHNVLSTTNNNQTQSALRLLAAALTAQVSAMKDLSLHLTNLSEVARDLANK